MEAGSPGIGKTSASAGFEKKRIGNSEKQEGAL